MIGAATCALLPGQGDTEKSLPPREYMKFIQKMSKMIRICSFLLFIAILNAFEIHPDQEWMNFELIPRSEMCSLCHSVISHFQESKMKDGKAFKEQLFMSCTLLRSPEEIDKCREDIDDEKLKQLDTKTVEEMCVEQKMCKKNEKPREFRTTLEVKTQTPISSNIETAFYTSKHGDSNGFKQFNSADSKAPLFFTVILTALAIFRR